MKKFDDPREAELAAAMLKYFREPHFVRDMYTEMQQEYSDITRDRMRAIWNRLEANGLLQKLTGNTRDLVLGTTTQGQSAINQK